MNGIVLITGASGGLAAATARQLADKGWQPALVTRDMSRVDRSGIPGGACLIEANVSTSQGAEDALAQCERELGGSPDALVNCAGSVLMSPLHRTAESQYRECVSANLDTAFFSLQAFVKACMQEKKSGAAVLVSSVTARIGVVNHEAIAASKAALEGLARSAAATYARHRIRVNVVAPGLMRSPATERLFAAPDASRQLDAQYPLGRHGQVGDVARTITWLVSPETEWITGQVLPVDGGFTSVRPLQRAG